MTIYDVLAMCPRTGHAIGHAVTADPQNFKNTAEGRMDQALTQLIKDTNDPKMSAFYCGIYSAYVSMTIELVTWEAIWFMLESASHWDTEEINEYKEGRA